MNAVWPPEGHDTPWPFVRSLIHLDVVESTNDRARQLAHEQRDDLPIAIWADRQTKGRGRADRTWWSDAGSLTFSLLVDPRMHALKTEHEPKLALAAAVAVVNTILLECGLPANIRWPNDVELDGRKLSGILPERVETSRGSLLVVGIGVNVSTQLDDAPAEVRRMSTSLHERIAPNRRVPEPSALLRSLLASFGASLVRLARDDEALAVEWADFDCLLNQPVRVDLGTRILTGVGRGIDVQGALLVEAAGEVQRLFGGRVLRN
ncbi:MAG: biotin--[acetyl-CoA-carboxylase] ligase [Isosphaeraceae bacterium]|nr:biotin--[acetyl-CoA-carboxylase] ligase [Isosphaeraceae bacterium]